MRIDQRRNVNSFSPSAAWRFNRKLIAFWGFATCCLPSARQIWEKNGRKEGKEEEEELIGSKEGEEERRKKVFASSLFVHCERCEAKDEEEGFISPILSSSLPIPHQGCIASLGKYLPSWVPI